jgi:hypothetical protein
VAQPSFHSNIKNHRAARPNTRKKMGTQGKGANFEKKRIPDALM